MLHRFALLLGLSALATSFARAQDYPYDDVEPKRDESALPKESRESSEEGYNGRFVRSKRLPPLFRIGLKAGGNFAYFQYPTSTTTSEQVVGFGGEGLFALGWDLPYQPLFLEFETGYRGLFLSTEYPLHVIPLSFGIFYRQRLGPRTLWKPGVIGSLDMRIAPKEPQENPSFGVFPSVSVGSILEVSGILFEPLFTLSRAQSQNMFFTAAFRTGFRF